MRARIVSRAVIFIFLFLSLSILNLGALHSKKYKDLSRRNCIRLLPQQGIRGRILDRNGNVIVDNKICYDLMLMPQETSQVNKVLARISQILNVDFQKLKEAFKVGYAAPFAPVTIARNIDIDEAVTLEELKPELNGIVIQPTPQRAYPHGRLACHAIGYLDEIDRWRLTRLENYGYKTKDIVGFGGMEEKYDYYLRQEEGGLSVEIDHRGRFRRVLGFKPARSGKDIQLTLDLKIQKIVENSLMDRKGSVIIMEPYSGQIIALANYPNFNPSVFIRKSGSVISRLFNDPDAPFVNRAISGLYPAGSLFKLIVASAALQLDKLKDSKTFFCPGSINIGKQEFACWDTHNQQNLFGAIVHSCNVFFYRTGLLLGPNFLHEYALKFGLSKPTAIDLPYEKSGFVPSVIWRRVYRLQNWFEGDTANLSIGQGELLVTPLQMLRMIAVFANGGTLVNPYIVKDIDGRDISHYQRKNTDLSLKKSVVNYIRQALRSVVSEPTGTANILSGLSVSVAGKTGTAQVPRGQPHGWFVGFFPYEKPEFAICVFLENGVAGYNACVVAKNIIETMVKERLIAEQR